MHWSAGLKAKVCDPRKEGLTEQVQARSHTILLFCILQNSRNKEIMPNYIFGLFDTQKKWHNLRSNNFSVQRFNKSVLHYHLRFMILSVTMFCSRFTAEWLENNLLRRRENKIGFLLSESFRKQIEFLLCHLAVGFIQYSKNSPHWMIHSLNIIQKCLL